MVLDSLDIEILGDFMAGDVSVPESSLAISMARADFSATGDFLAEVGANSSLLIDAQDMNFTTGGDLCFRLDGADAVGVFNLDSCYFDVDGALVLEQLNSQGFSTTVVLDNLDIEVAEDFRLSHPGADGEALHLLENLRGKIDRDWIVQGQQAGDLLPSKSTIVMQGIDFDVGRDVSFQGVPLGSQIMVIDGIILKVGGVLDFGANQTFAMEDAKLDVTGLTYMAGSVTAQDVELSGTLDANGEVRIAHIDVGGDLLVSGSLTVLNTKPGHSSYSVKTMGDLQITESSTFKPILRDVDDAVEFVFLTDGGDSPLVLDGELAVDFENDFEDRVCPTDTFILIRSNMAINGAFDNVASGERVSTEDGSGSFLVSYGAGSDEVKISDFQRAVPLPGPTSGPGQITKVRLLPDYLLLEWNRFGDGLNYSIWSSTTINGSSWSKIDPAISTGCTHMIIPIDANDPARFYRVESP